MKFTSVSCLPPVGLVSLFLLVAASEAHFNPTAVSWKTTTATKSTLRRCRRSSSTSLTTSSRYPSAFVDPRSLASAFSSFAENNAYATSFLSCSTLGTCADLVAQSSERIMKEKQQGSAVVVEATTLEGGGVQENGPENTATVGDVAQQDGAVVESNLQVLTIEKEQFSFDFRRTIAFMLYGGCYQGMSLHFIYNDVFHRLFGPNRALQKVLLSQLVMAPLLTLPVAYLFKGLVYGKTPRGAMEDYWIGLTQKGLLFSFWKLWVPIQFLIFTVIPVHLRIPFSSFFSFCWTVLLSRISNS